MTDFRSLRILDRFQGMFRKFGVSYPAMRAIVGLKLTMDERRVPVVFSQTKLKEGNQFMKSLALYVLYGLVTIPFLFFGDSPMLQMGFVFGISMFMIMTSLIADFSTVLLDVRDRVLLAAAPVDDRTLNAAKLVHITIYMSLMTLALLGIPSIVMLAVKGPVFFLLFLVMLGLLLLLIIALTAITYMVMLRLFDGERLKDYINYVQIALSIGLFAGYQVLIRSFDFVGLSVEYVFRWWHLLLPPLWFAAPFEWLPGGNGDPVLKVLSAMAVVIPLLAITLYIRKMPQFEQNLQKLLSEMKGGTPPRAFLMTFWEKLLCRDKEERACFRFAWQLMKREREFKLKVYPSLGIGFIAPFLFLYIFLQEGPISSIGKSDQFYMLYFSFLVIATLTMMLSYSEKYKGAWLFEVTPIRQPGVLKRGTLKASLAQLFLPIYLLQAVLFGILFGARIIPDILGILIAAVLYAAICYGMGSRGVLPFSRPMGESLQSGTAKQIIFMLLIGAFVIPHIILAGLPYGSWIYLVLIAIACIIGWRTVLPVKGMA
ncbi:hypothetical protein [Sporosarcina trichiuri]|uniref:hypothetical protein n=1 Tax=Sporosarcina trichiuri TaxID=3056445 RepID=UPI0025B30772|nr:hypothetical protein [Sporosarcina sp. 0.2-SM1T-5]WJY26839.1 hypothetical protein QWT68_12400 [Sporosarcina sp. 0.2-SM1T-5]